jgi:hypothetical protein
MRLSLFYQLRLNQTRLDIITDWLSSAPIRYWKGRLSIKLSSGTEELRISARGDWWINVASSSDLNGIRSPPMAWLREYLGLSVTNRNIHQNLSSRYRFKSREVCDIQWNMQQISRESILALFNARFRSWNVSTDQARWRWRIKSVSNELLTKMNRGLCPSRNEICQNRFIRGYIHHIVNPKIPKARSWTCLIVKDHQEQHELDRSWTDHGAFNIVGKSERKSIGGSGITLWKSCKPLRGLRGAISANRTQNSNMRQWQLLCIFWIIILPDQSSIVACICPGQSMGSDKSNCCKFFTAFIRACVSMFLLLLWNDTSLLSNCGLFWIIETAHFAFHLISI